MPPIKREAVFASIRSQLMTDPQRGTMLLLNLLKLFADRKDDAEFVKELAELAGDLATVSFESVYSQNPLFAQPVPMPYLQGGSLPGTSIPVPSFADFSPSEQFPPEQRSPKRHPQPEQQKPIAENAVSALNQMGEDTTPYTTKPKSDEPDLPGYEEWTPKPRRNNGRKPQSGNKG